MAETRARNNDSTVSRDDPVLRPGRPADPGSQPAPVPAPAPPARSPLEAAGDEAADASEEQQSESSPDTGTEEGDAAASAEDSAEAEAQDDADDADDVQRLYAESYQRRLRRLLRQCERVNLMDFNVLSLAGWPDNHILNAARRRRDTWLLSATIAALVFLSGMTGFVPAWLAGGGFGAFAVILLMGLPVVRRLYSPGPSYLDLVLYRQQLLRDARKHIAHLEGEVGLIWQCNELSEFNPALASTRFSTLKHLSEQRRLAASLSRREHIRLYLIFMLEAEKAYQRMQAAYFQEHQKAIDRGWKTVADAVTEPREQALREGAEAPQKPPAQSRDSGPGQGGQGGSDDMANG
ncbi:hypothetical protein [Marinobacter zhanjiangensis]|uniref:Uncharacterized protein n=1 Tax=Marinobacter zhanjiangensis TaxID=578215 RepID=A0ABQ3ATV1_9GAMM|nr:hypothetical protein [Marinobacter zhanjiangensis]GGY64011.1 hypothetical protein GCM10007071_08290 [Marinobacter zhanjiangensis]